MDFIQRWEALKVHSDTSNKLVEDLMWYCKNVEESFTIKNAHLTSELEDATLDLDDARKSRRELQQLLNSANQKLDRYSQDVGNMKNRNSYVMILIDGDGLIFADEYIQRGLEGGKAAANALRTSVLKHCSELSDDVEVIAKVVANVSGLSKALKREGFLDDVDLFRDFTLGFTQGKASFDFIDVGYGKERADSKIKDVTRWNLRNHNCKQILLGISHDAGYAPFLDEILKDESTTRQISIVEGPPTVRELAQTGVRVLNFNTIFRTEKLTDKQYSLPVTAPQITKTFSWAGVIGVAPTPPPAQTLIMPLSNIINNGKLKKEETKVKEKEAWSPGPRGLDEPMIVNAAVLEKIKRRTANSKLCNNHYLRGPCSKRHDGCPFVHNEEASEEDLKAISLLTRLNPCINGQDCDSEYCIYGHHCPSTNNGVCQQFGCRYSKEEHPPGTVIKHPRKEKARDQEWY